MCSLAFRRYIICSLASVHEDANYLGKHRVYSSNGINILFKIFTVAMISAQASAQVNTSTTVCLDHNECDVEYFCGSSSCIDTIGRSYLCGRCKPCAECVCNKDAVDGACPNKKCTEQPTDSVRFLQGPFFASEPISGIPTYLCVRRLLFEVGSFFDVQAAICVDHPASASPVNQTSVEEQCPAFTRTGIIIGLSTPEASPDTPFLLDVVVTSEGPLVIRNHRILP